jgi:prepilin-type N-terminal cleavage/methylation domain-containing protein
MDKRGFTLVELLIVIAIIGILAAIAIPAYVGQQKSAARTEAYSNLQNLRLLEEQFFAENGCYYMTGATPVCTNATRNGVGNIQYIDYPTNTKPFLPGFKPIDITTDPSEAGLNFSYSITTNSTGVGGGTASCFVATATGKTGRRVAGDSFTINCNNNRNF